MSEVGQVTPVNEEREYKIHYIIAPQKDTQFRWLLGATNNDHIFLEPITNGQLTVKIGANIYDRMHAWEPFYVRTDDGKDFSFTLQNNAHIFRFQILSDHFPSNSVLVKKVETLDNFVTFIGERYERYEAMVAAAARGFQITLKLRD